GGITRYNFDINLNAGIALDLPSGELNVAQFYKVYEENQENGVIKGYDSGQYELDTSVVTRPVCRISLLTVNTDAQLVITYKVGPTSTSLTIPSEAAWALIYNASKDRTKDETKADNHFRHYAQLGTVVNPDDVATVTNARPPVNYPQSGEWVDDAIDALKKFGTLNQTQCSNSQWP
ncbi:MAG: hypothetical protein ACREMY_07045, partial [bacterium]